MAIVKLTDVRKSYALGKVEVPAVKGVSFSIEKGDFISIAGPSGSGKSTILNLIGCIDTPTDGVVEIDGRPTGALFDRVWGEDTHGDIGTVSVHIRRIREKIERDPAAPEYIVTVWGVGYRFEV